MSGKVFNVASGVGTRLDALYALIVQLLRESGMAADLPQPNHQPWRVGEIMHSYGSPERTAELLNFSCKVALADGLRHMLVEEYGAPEALKLNSHHS